MVKITLYNIGEPKEVVVFIIIFYTSFVLTVCIPNIKRVSYLGRRIQVLRCFGTLRAKAFKRIICNAIRFPTKHLHYI